MIIACPACSTRYAVPDSAIGLEGRTVRCAKCRHSWFQDGPELELTAPPPMAQASPAAPAPSAAATEPLANAADFADAAPPTPTAAPAGRPEAAPRPAPRDTLTEPGFSPRRPVDAKRSVDDRVSAYYDDTGETRYSDEGSSSFDFSPPFRPRRNWAKIGMIASVLFAVVTLGLTGAIAWAGLPDWVPLPRQTFAQGQSDLVLDFPADRQDRKKLPNGAEYFQANGTVRNIGSQTRSVPTILVILRDARERVVYSWEVVPPKRQLAPGETLSINEAVTDVPKSAVNGEIGWKAP